MVGLSVLERLNRRLDFIVAQSFMEYPFERLFVAQTEQWHRN